MSFNGKSFYAEGTRAGAHEIEVFLTDGGTLVDRDRIEINVEKIVYPMKEQWKAGPAGTLVANPNWQLEQTPHWEGFTLTDAWHIEKALVDYIKDPGSQGFAATRHPNKANGTASDTGDPLSPSQGDYGGFTNGFNMQFNFAFDTSRGDGTTGWVKILNDQDNDGQKDDPVYKISNVGNSGVKFGGQEAAILDLESMVNKAGGLASFLGVIMADGRANLDTLPPPAVGHTYRDEYVHALMSGVLYKGDYGFEPGASGMMTDWPKSPAGVPLPESQLNYRRTFMSNLFRPNAKMEIDVTPVVGANYNVEILLDGVKTYGATNIALPDLSVLYLQSHWGSGVIFTGMNIVKK
jgi:hypothetical protein